jgi:DNA-binding MarR family transcriptional regulator
MPRRPRQAPARARSAAQGALADRLHSAAIRLLRRLRAEDAASGVSAPRLSALSVLVFGGPHTIGELAAAEQVRPPTISRLVRDLERDGLVERAGDPDDARVQRVRASAAGRALLAAGRARRVERLAASVAELTAEERAALAAALPLLERLAAAPR